MSPGWDGVSWEWQTTTGSPSFSSASPVRFGMLFALPAKVAKAHRYNAQPAAEHLLRGRQGHPESRPEVFHRLVKGHLW